MKDVEWFSVFKCLKTQTHREMWTLSVMISVTLCDEIVRFLNYVDFLFG